MMSRKFVGLVRIAAVVASGAMVSPPITHAFAGRQSACFTKGRVNKTWLSPTSLPMFLVNTQQCSIPRHFRFHLHSTAPSWATTSQESEFRPDRYQVSIEYCTGCRWGMRAFWMAQELLTTFEDTATLQAVTLIPSTISGRFLVQSFASDGTMSSSKQLWDRTSDDGFPEMKVLKQLVRDEIDPNRFLGHSDRDETKLDTLKAAASTPKDMESQYSLPHIDEIIPPVFATKATLPSSDHPDDETNAKNDIVLLYCTGCRWLLRAAYFAQELLATFNDQELRSVTLVPSRPPANPGGTFVIQLEMAVDNDGQVYDNNSMPKQSISSLLLWDRSEQNRFPDIKELKQLVRDQLNPSKDLGHSETARPTTLQEEENESMDEKSAQKARDFFGVS